MEVSEVFIIIIINTQRRICKSLENEMTGIRHIKWWTKEFERENVSH